MYIECFKNNGKDYLRLVKNQRVVNSKGIKTSTKSVVMNIGPLDRFDDGLPDYVERLKRSFKAGAPLIPSLQVYCEDSPAAEVYRFSITEGSPDCFGHPKLFAHVLLERMLEELGLNTFFSSYKAFSKSEYDVYGFAKLLIFGRLLNPASKSSTVRQNEDYFTPVLEDFNPDNVYDTLDFIYENKDKIIRRINTNLVKKAGRSPEMLYYDVTNFYFETERIDDDVLDENGELIEKGLRKMGVSKEERRLPIVQMGLFMDDNGIPIAMEAFPGNTLDHQTLRSALQKNIDDLNFSRFILVADRGICSYKNLLQVKDGGNGYIVSKSLLKSPKDEQRWAYADEGFTPVGKDFRYKSRIVKRTVTDDAGVSQTVEEQVVVYWSRKFQQRCEKENQRFLAFLEKLETSPESFRLTALQAKSVRKFFKKDCVNTQTGEVISSDDIKTFVDFDKVREYRETMGFYQIVTSELTMDPLDVIEKYHGLTQIEDQFRVMKGELETRPIFVRTPEHIEAHLLICMIALILMRIIQRRILRSGLVEASDSACWNTGMSAERIKAALNRWKVDRLPEELYRFMDVDDPDLSLILRAFQIEPQPKLYRKAELREIKSSIKVFM